MTAGANHPLIHGARTKVVLAAGCLALLGIGWLAAREAPRPVAETVAPMLESEVQRREPARIFEGVRKAGLAAVPFTVAFVRSAPGRRTVADFAGARSAVESPAGFGLVVSSGGEVLSHLDAVSGSPTATAILAGGARMESEVVAYEPATGLVLVRLAATPDQAEPPLAPAPAAPGSAVVAVGHSQGLEFVAPVFIGAAREDAYVLTGAAGALLPGMPVVDLEGQVLAVASSGAAPVRAHAVGPSVSRLRKLLAEGRGLPRTIGVTLQAIDAGLQPLLGPGAAVVADMLPSGPAARAGLRPGDVLLAVGPRPLTTLEAALQAISVLRPDEPVPLTVRRGEREHPVTVVPEVTLEKPGGSRHSPAERGDPRATDLFPAAVLLRAGVPPDAVVLSIDGAPVRSAADADRALRRRRGAVLVRARQDGSTFFAAVEPGA